MKRHTAAMVTMGDIYDDDSKLEFTKPSKFVYLFTTKTCPNCKLVKQYLGNFPYIQIDAEENPELACKYNVRQAPTLVVVQDDTVRRFAGAGNIKKFVEDFALTMA